MKKFRPSAKRLQEIKQSQESKPKRVPPKARGLSSRHSKTITVMQVAAHLNISRSVAYTLVRSEGFPKLLIGKRILVPSEAFGAWIKQNTQTTYGGD